jgi:hypothetical protein
MRMAPMLLVLLALASGCNNDNKCADARAKAAAALKECLDGPGCGVGMSDTEKAAAVAAYLDGGQAPGMMADTDDPSYKRLLQANTDAKKVCAGK